VGTIQERSCKVGALLTQLTEKETERERGLTLFQRGTISDDEAERELDAVAREAGQLREMIESLRADGARESPGSVPDRQRDYLAGCKRSWARSKPRTMSSESAR
jgi:hypothetical protein